MMAYETGITLADLLNQTPLEEPTATGSKVFISSSPTSSGLNAIMKYSYRTLMANASNLSFSLLEVLESCPRRFELDKLTASLELEGLETNIDFVYGHAVAAGVQHYLAFGDRDEAMKHLVFAWNADLLLNNAGFDKAGRKKGGDKSIWEAITALEIFFDLAPAILSDWEVATFKGRPAIELSFRIDLENGYFYYGHVDLILRNLVTGELMVLELKTNGSYVVDEAAYKNSPQALGYTLVLDAIAAELGGAATFHVLYLVYKTKTREYVPLTFTKTFLDRANWMRTVLLQCEEIAKYTQIGFFPKRKQGCNSYMRRCPYFDTCTMSNRAISSYASIEQIQYPDEQIENDFQYTISDLIRNQQQIIRLHPQLQEG